MSRDPFPVGKPGTGDDGVRAAIAALSEGESQVQHAVRLAAVVRRRDTNPAERVQLLRRALTIEPRVARQVALDVADDEDERLRTAASGVLASTMGSEDDLPRLLSLVADERLVRHRSTLQAATDAVQAPDVDESVALLLRLAGVSGTGLKTDLETLVPAEMHRGQFIRWVNKSWARGADHRRPSRFVDAISVVAGIIVDQTVMQGSRRDRDLGVTPDEIDQIVHSLRDRPDVIDLVRRDAVVGRWPWIDSYVDLALVARRELGAPGPRMAVLGAREINAATDSLGTLVAGWLAVMQNS